MDGISFERQKELIELIAAGSVGSIKRYNPDEKTFIVNRWIENALERLDDEDERLGEMQTFLGTKNLYDKLVELGLECSEMAFWSRINEYNLKNPNNKKRHLFSREILNRVKKRFSPGYHLKSPGAKTSYCSAKRQQPRKDDFLDWVRAAVAVLAAKEEGEGGGKKHTMRDLAATLHEIDPKIEVDTLVCRTKPSHRSFDENILDMLKRFVIDGYYAMNTEERKAAAQKERTERVRLKNVKQVEEVVQDPKWTVVPNAGISIKQFATMVCTLNPDIKTTTLLNQLYMGNPKYNARLRALADVYCR